MNAFSRIDMGEVTRLTKAGKLKEAMTLLQGPSAPSRVASMSSKHAATRAKVGAARSSAIDMVAPADPGGAWTAPPVSRPQGDDASFRMKRSATPSPFPESMRPMLERVGLGSTPGVSGLGQFAPPRASGPLPDGARFEERTFSNAAGSRAYKLYVPSGYKGQRAPLVVMLHGCTQSPDDFATGTKMNELAEEHMFLVVYPAQPQSANMSKCWNWFNAGDQKRDGGEPSLIAGITRQTIRDFKLDPARVYVAGLSAGGAAAAIMASAYPDLYAAVGVHSGLACGSAKDMPSAFAAMNGGGTVGPKGLQRRVPTIVFHGDSDRTVHPINGDQVIAQSKPENELTKSVTHGEAPGGRTYTRTVQSDDSGHPILEQWLLHGAGHAWAGGSPNGSYTDPCGPDASREMLRFFLEQANAACPTRH